MLLQTAGGCLNLTIEWQLRMDSTQLAETLWGLSATHEFWDQELGGYSKQFCFKDRWSDELENYDTIFTDHKLANKWHEEQKRYWHKDRLLFIEEVINGEC